MGGLFKGSSNRSNSQSIDSTLRVQTSIAGRPRPIGAGQNRIAGNMVWWGDFQAIKQKQQGGKGGVGGSMFGKNAGGTQYAYYASAIVSICEGPITSVDTLWNGSAINFYSTPSAEILADLAAIGITPTYGDTYPVTFKLGTYPQAPWSYLVSAHPSAAIGYQGHALACFTNLSLGSSASFPNFSWEITWGLHSSLGSTTKDVNAIDWVEAFLTNQDWGCLGFPSALLADLSASKTFCRAFGLFMSPLLSDQATAQAHLQDVMKAIACDFKWSEGKLDVGIYSAAAASLNDAVYTPATTPVYHLTDADFIEDETDDQQTTVRIKRKDPNDAVNTLQLEYLDRGYLYNPVLVQLRDDAEIQSTGWENPSDLRSFHFWCQRRPAMQSAGLQLARERMLATYEFTVGSRRSLLELFDVVTLTEPKLGLDHLPVLITEIEEKEDRTLFITAEDLLVTGGSVTYAVQPPLGSAANALVAPGAANAPIIFEPPATLAQNQIWMLTSGVNPATWGGCNVWLSTDGGSTYVQTGQIVVAGRQGFLTSALPAVDRNAGGLTVDSANPLAINLSQSQGQVGGGSEADLLALTTLCYVGGELVSYQSATLTGQYRYSLSPLVRGAYGSDIEAHAIGTQFARLDDAVFAHAYTAAQIGSTVKVKLQSFNIYGAAAEDLSALPAYTYTIIGSSAARTETQSVTTSDLVSTSVTFAQAFASGLSGSPVPFVNISWIETAGDTLTILSVTTTEVVFEIRNDGDRVERAATVVAQGY